MEESVTNEGVLPRQPIPIRRLAVAQLRRLNRQMVLSGLLSAAVLALVGFAFWGARESRCLRGAAWGLVLLSSMAGWGCILERIAFPRRAADLGLRLAWGAGALIAWGGVLCLLTVATRPVLLTLVLGGAGFALYVLINWGRREMPPTTPSSSRSWSRGWSPGAWVVLVALFALAATYYMSGASGGILNINDDHAAYLIFPKKILATGTLIEPFSVRRITAFGGQSFLQALTMAGARSPLQMAMLDLGISLLIAMALLLGSMNEKTPRTLRNLWLLPILFLLCVPNTRANSASEMSGVMIFLALFRTASYRGFKERPFAGAAVLGLLAAAACTLRHSYLVPVAVFMVVFYAPAGLSALRAASPKRRETLATIAVAAGALLLALLPWAVLSYRSNRTFLFPLVNGNYRPEYGALTTQSGTEERIKFFWSNICHCHPIRSLPFFIFAGLLIGTPRTRPALRALCWAALVGFAAVVYSLPLSDNANISRYYFGFTLATVLAVMVASFSALPRRRLAPAAAGRLIPVVLAIAAVVVQVQESREGIYKDYLRLESSIKPALDRTTSTLQPRDERYRHLQASVPAGAPMLVMLDESFWLDFQRNRIDILDLPGAASPSPGMPLDNDQALVDYLAAHRYRYVAYVKPASSKSLYRRTHWARMLANPEAPIWKLSAPFYLNTFDRFESLTKTRTVLYQDGDLVALDLGTMKSP